MKIILLERVAGLGKVGDAVNVRRGYGRNFLIPFGKATIATPKNIAEFEKRRGELERKANDALSTAQRKAEEFTTLVVKIEARAGEEGKLFGSIGPREIAEATTKSGHAIQRSAIRMPAGPIRHVGEYDVEVQLHGEVVVPLKINIVASEE